MKCIKREKSTIAEIVQTVIAFFALVFVVFELSPRWWLLGNDIEKKANDGHLKSQIQLAELSLEVGDYKESYLWYRKASLHKNNQNAGYVYGSLGYFGNIGFFYDDSNLRASREMIAGVYKKALDYLPEDNNIRKQLCENYILFILGNVEPKQENDRDGNPIEKNYSLDSSGFISEQLKEIRIAFKELSILDNDIANELNRIGFDAFDDNQLLSFLKNELSQYSSAWEYDYTRVSTESGLAFTSDMEKLVQVDSWDELTDPTAFTTITKYKYYHYVRRTNIDEYDVKNKLHLELHSLLSVKNGD